MHLSSAHFGALIECVDCQIEAPHLMLEMGGRVVAQVQRLKCSLYSPHKNAHYGIAHVRQWYWVRTAWVWNKDNRERPIGPWVGHCSMPRRGSLRSPGPHQVRICSLIPRWMLVRKLICQCAGKQSGIGTNRQSRKRVSHGALVKTVT
jgi:hypothetical protein